MSVQKTVQTEALGHTYFLRAHYDISYIATVKMQGNQELQLAKFEKLIITITKIWDR